MIPYVNPELYSKLAKNRAAEAPFDVLTYCAACRSTFASVGKPAIQRRRGGHRKPDREARARPQLPGEDSAVRDVSV